MMVPVSSAATIARNTCMVALPRKAVELYIKENATMPMAIIEGKERSISAAMTTMVRVMAMMAKNGMEDMKAE